MDFSLTDEEALLGETAAAFASRELRPRQREHEDTGVSAEVAAAFRDTGLHLLGLPGSEGAGVGLVAQVRVAEELAFGDAGAAVALLGPTWTRLAAEALGATEQPGFARVLEALPREPGEAAWVLGEGPLLELDLAGRWRVLSVVREPVRSLGLRAASSARCRPEKVLALGEARPELALARLRLLAASLLVGLARAALEHVRGYLPARRAFGKPLSQHQGLAFIVAEMAMRTEAARLLVLAAALAFERGSAAEAASAWLEAAEAAHYATDQGVQLLGGHGFMKDHPVEKWMRDARSASLLYGGPDPARELVAEAAWT